MALDFKNEIPIYIQLIEEIKLSIITGKIKPGEKLLSVRENALEYGVNPNTIQKALIELENDKLIYTERTNGKFVTNDTNLINNLKNEVIKNKINKFIKDLNNIGVSKEEIINYIMYRGEDK